MVDTDLDKLMTELKQKRDELAVQIHLGSKEAQQQWEELENQWNEFAGKAQLQESAEDIEAAASGLGDELAKGYDRLKKALSS
jgi:hypothetical protein